jgi:hypothetical protein
MVEARSQYWSCFARAQSARRLSEARIDFLTLWASRDGYIPMDFSTKCARGHCAAEASELGWG